MDTGSALTLGIARHVSAARFDDLPEAVRRHALNCFLNFVGCAAGGSRNEAVEAAERALAVPGDRSAASVIGRSTATHPQLSALLNCIAASVYAFDDTHAEAMVHPSSIVGSALIGLAGAEPAVRGEPLLLAFTWGVEMMCRLSKALSVPPAKSDIGWSQSGVTGAIGSALACGKLLGFSAEQLANAMGIAASTAGGLRAGHGSMTMHLVPSQGAALGVQAALLARAGFTGPASVLETRYGFLKLFAQSAHAESLTQGLGTHFEIMANVFKAYPCGIVMHSAIDACMQLAPQLTPGATIERIEAHVASATVALTDKPRPAGEFEAQVSLQHWAAAVLLQGEAGVEQGTQATIDNPDVRSLSDRCRVIEVPGMPGGAAEVRLWLTDGRTLACRVDHCRGSLANPLDDAALDQKFLAQAGRALGPQRARRLLEQCRALPGLPDVAVLWNDELD